MYLRMYVVHNSHTSCVYVYVVIIKHTNHTYVQVTPYAAQYFPVTFSAAQPYVSNSTIFIVHVI